MNKNKNEQKQKDPLFVGACCSSRYLPQYFVFHFFYFFFVFFVKGGIVGIVKESFGFPSPWR